VNRAEELADPPLGIAHSGLERLSDHIKQQAPPRLPGRHGRDPAATDEHP
jgi:hypothetical protein